MMHQIFDFLAYFCLGYCGAQAVVRAVGWLVCKAVDKVIGLL